MNQPRTRLAVPRPRTAVLLLAAAAAWALPTAAAAQVTVLNANDTMAGSLRQAVLDASPGDVIDFDPSLNGQTITLASEILLDQSITLDAAGQGITISGGNATRIFRVDAGAAPVTVDGLTLNAGRGRGGNGESAMEGGGGGALGAGGAVFAQSGTVTLRDIVFTGNAAVGGDGGAAGGGGTGGGGGGLGGDASGNGGGPGLGSVGGGGTGGANSFPESGTAGAFGGGGGGGGFSSFGGGAGGAGGFGAGAGGSGGDRGFGTAAGGLGGGDGETRGFGVFGGGSGGGGAGLGGAVFVAEGVTLTFENTVATAVSANTTTAGTGFNAGQAAGGLVFAQGTAPTLRFEVASGVTQTLDVSAVADENALSGGTNTAGLTKAGLGTLVLTGNNAFGGGLTASAGRLTVNGLLTNNALVQAGGTLGGSGTVVNLTNTGGTVAPGNSIDTLDVTGDFSQDSAGTLEIEFDASDIDQLDITGDATLAGTIRFVELATGTLANAPARTFLTAENINGAFDATTTVFASGSTLTGATISIDTGGPRDTAGVVFSDFVAQFADQAATQTGAAAGGVIDGLAVSDPGGSVPIINALNASANVTNALESQGNTLANAAAVQGHAAQQLVADTARARVWGLSGRALARQAADQLAAAEQAAGTAWFTIAQGLETGLPPQSESSAEPAGWATPGVGDGDPSFWVQAVGRFGEIDGDATSFGFDAATYGVSLGAEWSDAPRDAVAGVFVGFTESQVEINGLNDEADIENLQLGVYGSTRLDTRWSLNGSGSISTLNFDTARATSSGTADGEFDGLGLYGALEALYDWGRNDHRVISPFVGIEASTIDRDGYAESGAGVLNLNAQGSSDTFLASVVGVQVASDYVLDNGWRLTPAARVGWAYQHLDDSASTTSAFASAATSPFSSSGPGRSRSSVRLGVSLDLTPGESDRWGLFARYTGDLTDDAQDHVVQAGVRFTF